MWTNAIRLLLAGHDVQAIAALQQQAHTEAPSRPPSITKRLVRALYDFEAAGPEELSVRAGDMLYARKAASEDHWLFGYMGDRCGLVPTSYVEVCCCGSNC